MGCILMEVEEDLERSCDGMGTTYRRKQKPDIVMNDNVQCSTKLGSFNVTLEDIQAESRGIVELEVLKVNCAY